eukprot:108025-Rhodomonas_salina.1
MVRTSLRVRDVRELRRREEQLEKERLKAAYYVWQAKLAAVKKDNKMEADKEQGNGENKPDGEGGEAEAQGNATAQSAEPEKAATEQAKGKQKKGREGEGGEVSKEAGSATKQCKKGDTPKKEGMSPQKGAGGKGGQADAGVRAKRALL